ncbi:MAG: preprotein translocase subunit SecG [Gammaproteobacteria bacterium]|nr:preprotein translocase subunit SecG [Gammaproteobacteria bacterium]
MLYAGLLVLHTLIAISIIALVLLQQGKGASMGAAFGSGASATVFGARGSASFLTKLTTGLAIVFFANCLVLAYLSSHRQPAEGSSIVEQYEQKRALEQKDNAAIQTRLQELGGDVPGEGFGVAPASNTAPATPADVPPAQ